MRVDFGRTEDPAQVCFALPRPTAEDLARLGGGPLSIEGGWLRVGAPAFQRRDWVGKLYPRGLPQARWLAFYARRAGALELCATFYGVPDEKTVEGWREATPPGFRFCPKLPEEITHKRGLHGVEAEVARFCRALLALGDRLGEALVQLPPSFAPDRLPQLARFLPLLRRHMHVAVEVRHEGWFQAGALEPRLAAVLRQNDCSAVITDVAGRRDACHATLTSRRLLLRFVGNGRHPADGPRLDAWLERLAELRRAGLEEACFFVHQPDDVLAPELMDLFAEKARARGFSVPPVLEGAGDQLELL